MKLIKYILFTLAIILLSANTFAAGYVGNGTIKMMQNAYGGWIMHTNGAANNPDVCAKNTIILSSSYGPQYKEVYSFLLSAYTAVKPVQIYVNG